MGFFDKVKNVASDAANALTDAVNDVTDNAKELNEKAKINRAIKAEEAKINNLYTVMGEKLFNGNTAAPGGFEDQFAGVNAAKNEVERLKKELSEIEAALKCPKCGAKINSSQKFCQGCGNVLNPQSTAQEQPAANPAPTAIPAPQVIETTAQEAAPAQASFIPTESQDNN